MTAAGEELPAADGDVPAADDQVPAWWAGLGLPGLIDLHVHFMPERVLAKVWAYFDSAGPLTGRRWPIHYRYDETTRLRLLAELGVRAFPSLVYPHRPGMAAWLNGWAADFAAAHPQVIPTATMFPEPETTSYVESALRGGARMWKLHVQVGGFDPADPQLDPAWGLLTDAGVPVVTHAGSGPTSGAHTGPGPIEAVLARHPRLTLVIAHLGMPEVHEFLDIAERYDRVHLDTTMAFTDFSSGGRDRAVALGQRLRTRLLALQSRIVLGSDFPNIPYPYAHQLAALQRLGLGDDWLRAVCWHNPLRLLKMTEADLAPVSAAAGPPPLPPP